jgi:hypothetical protein
MNVGKVENVKMFRGMTFLSEACSMERRRPE